MRKIKKGDFKIILYSIFIKLFKCKENQILIASNTKNQLYGNLLYIYEELKEYDYNIKILTMDDKCSFKERMKYEFKILFYSARFKYILIDDYFNLMYTLKIRNEAKFIQVWHALGAFKKVGYARPDYDKKSKAHKNYTDTIVSSDSVVDNYAEAFGIDRSKVHPIGVPRTDLFFDNVKKDNIKKQIYLQYPFLQGKRIILFAPTFRGEGRNSAYYPNELIDLKNIYQNLKEDDIFILKLHPFIKKRLVINDEFKDKIIDFTNYKDINELLLITDLLITDYSSVIFEYSFMEKPIIFYVPDLIEYGDRRSFFYEYNEYVYGSIATNQEQLIKNIKNPRVDKEKIKEFKNKFLNRCDGNSTKRFIEELILK